MRTGGTVTLGTAAGDQPVTVVGVVPALPTGEAGRPGVLVDLRTLADLRAASGLAAADATRPGEWWLALRDGRAGPALKELAAHPDWGRAAGDRLALRDELLDAPLGAALQSALVLGFAAALAFAVVAFVVNAVVSARERAREFTVLRALGVPPRQVAGMLAVEQAFLVGLGLAGGLMLGLLVARLVVPKIVLTVQAAAPYPPADLVVRWPLVLGVTAGVALVLALVVAVLLRVLHRRGLGADLRAGEDR
ncbi:FtsX-like permease family protein [Spirillospora sp. CA-253888]